MDKSDLAILTSNLFLIPGVFLLGLVTAPMVAILFYALFSSLWLLTAIYIKSLEIQRARFERYLLKRAIEGLKNGTSNRRK